ncbi:MAG TPA: DUF6265 family protein [Gemmatimonadales bacterium]|jgi:hypothetical protein|nr:DUF6265 family protein [Gemmatimonadales bacterium]
MRIPGLLLLAGVLLSACSSSLPAQQPPAPAEKPKEPPKPGVDFAKFKFMEGCWAAQTDKDNTVEENWTAPAENLLLATTRYLHKKRATGYEFTRIQWMDSIVVFAASSDGKPEEVYPMKALADEYVLFENLTKKFPQRIMYRMASDGALIPRNEGDGPSIELRFQRVKCPGADKKN